MTPSGKEAAYCEKGIDIIFLWAACSIALLALAVTAFIFYKHLSAPTADSWRTAAWCAWLGWVVIPPLWFNFEYQFLFKKYGPDEAFEAFKYGQDVASKVWLGIAAALTGLIAK